MSARIEGVEYTLSLQGIGPVHVKRIKYREALNEPYRLDVECLIPGQRDKPVQKVCEEIAGVDGTLVMERNLQSTVREQVHGLVVGVERASSRYELAERRANGDVGRPEEAMDDTFIVHLAPALEMLRLHTWGTGSWHERTYPEVLVKVLGEALGAYGREVTDRTTQTTKIDHIVRPPDESLLAFAQRIMRVAGITSYFTHDSGSETLVLVDDNDGFIEGTQYQPRSQPFRVDYTQRHNLSENVQAVAGSAGVEPKKVEFVSFDRVGTPPVPIEGTAEGSGPGEATERNWGALRPTEIGNADKQHEDAATLVIDRAATVRNTVRAKTTIIGMLPGRTYELELMPGDVRTYAVRSVKAMGIGAEYGTREDYKNEVELVPLSTDEGPVHVQGSAEADVPTRTMPGLTLAEIVAIENPPVEVDRLLRCRLKFLWDQQEGESPTTWVSVLQNMAGLFGGSQWIPREGDRVVVAFHEGRPDRGVILGSLYDEELKPPYMGPPDRSSVLPQSASWLGWNHSSIEPGKRPKEQGSLDRHTMLCMDVTANQELFYFQAPKDWRRDVGNDSEANIVRHQTVDIGGDRKQKVAGAESETVGKDYAQDIDGSRSVKVGGSETIDVSGSSNVSSGGKRTDKFSGGYSRTVTGSMSTTTLGGSRTDRVVGGKWQQTSAVAMSFAAPIITISAAFVGFGGGGSGQAAGAELSLKTKAKLEGPQGATLKGGTSTVSAELRGVSSHGRSVQARDDAGGRTNLADGSYVVDAPRGVTLRCGSTELRLTPEGLYLDGHRVSISATDTEIETTRLDINGETPGTPPGAKGDT